MADESNQKAESSNASDILKSLTQGVNPEMAESAKKLVIAMKNASEEEYNALLKMLSNSNTPDADEKPSVKDEGNVVLPGDAQLDGKQPEVFVKNEVKGEDHEESTSENLENDLNELENGENGYNSDSEKLPDNISSTSNGFTSKAPEVSSKCDKPDDELLSVGENSGVDQLEVINDKFLYNETRLPELSDEAKKQADKFPSTGEKSADTQFEGTNGNSDSMSNLLKVSLEAANLPKVELTMDKCFPDSQFEATEGSSFGDTEGFKLPELSLEHGRLADQLDTVGKNSYGDVHGDASSSDSEELPELLSNKAEDTCSEIEDGENNELSGTSIAQIDASHQNRSIQDLTPSMQANSRTNLLSGTTETEKDYSKRSSYELSSDDDHVTSSSSNLELTSTGSELSDEVAPSDTVHSRRLDIDGKNPDDNEIRDVNAVNGDDPVHMEGRKEPAAEGVHVIERLSPILSTGTQTSTEPEKHLHKEHLANKQICDTFGGGFDGEGLDSILGFKDKGSSKLPFYYQPQIVMHEQKPVLVLQPVSLSSLLPSENNVDVSGVENDAVKARVPIILPLTSPDFDEATRDAILKQINEESEKSKIDDSLMQGYSGEVSSLSTISTRGKNSEAASSSSVRQDITKVNGKPVADKSSKVSIEGLPEWVPSCELDRAFSAVTEQDTSSTTVETSAPLTFPTVSLPSTNPFAKDLAALHTGHSDGKVEDLSNLGLDKSLQQSLFGPPTPSSVASGARPKHMKVFQEAGHNGTATNPFTPDLTPKKRGKRQQQGVTDHSTAVVVSAEVHPSVSQSGAELNRPLPRSPRPRISSESMVTVIETTYADTPASSAEMLSLPNDEPNKVEAVPVDHNTQLESKERLLQTTKPKLRVPGKVAPFWVPDFACSNCTHCNARFSVFLRKHHCRACGKIFCKNCCSQLASFPYMDNKIGRVCPSCTEAIREVHRSKRNEKTPNRQTQTVNAPGQGLVISGTPAQGYSQQQSRATSSTAVPLNPGLQRNQSNMPGTSQQIPIASSSGMVSLSQETQRSLPKRAVPYQPLSIPSVRAQNPALQSTGQPQGFQQPQGPQSVMRPSQPANQYMWVPASSLFVNPVAPTLQGGPVLVPAAPFTPQQAPVVLMPSQPPSSLHLSQAATKPLNTMPLGGPRGETTVANKTSSETVSTFSVLPQHVGQTATQSAQSSYAGSMEQPVLTSRQASSTVGSESSRGVLPESPSLSQSRVQATSLPSELPSTASSSPIIAGHPSVTLQQQFSIPPVNQAGQSPQQPSGLPPSTFLPHSSPETVSPTPHQAKPASATFVSSPRRSSPSTTAVSPTQRSPPAAANSPREGTVIQAGQFRPHPTGHPPPTSLPLSSPETVSPSPHQTKSAASATSISSPSTTAASPTRRSPSHAAANSSREGSENQESQGPKPEDGSSLFSDETGAESKDFKPPLRRAGRTITWRYRTQGKSKLQMHKKSLAKDLRAVTDLPDGVKIQAAPDLLVHVKKMKVREKNREILVWCYQSEGLKKFRHLEVVVMLEVRKKEEIFPEEVLRVYRGILHLASKLGNSFQHGNYLSSNDQFLDSLDDAGFIFVSSEVKPKPPGLRQIQGPFLYGLLVKRLELQAAMFTPSRLLLRLGYDMKSFPFPLWNCRDRKPIYLGNENQDRFFHTVFAMNKYLKNSVPEAMVPGLCVVKEDNKVVLQIPNSGQTAVVDLLDRLIKKENQTATVPLVSDIPPYVDNCQVVICNERGGRSIQSFGNPACASVQGLGFLMLHLGVDASSPLSFGGELLDDGVLVFFSKGHTQKLRQSLEEKTNCYFYLGDRFDISHFELRWVQDINYDDMPETEMDGSLTNSHPAPTTSADTPVKEPGAGYYPGLATIDIRYSGYGSEISLLKEVFEDHTKILHILEGNIRRACTEPLMKHESKMKAGEHLDLQLRVVLKPSYKKWSIGPNDLPTALIRSLQMALSTVKVPVVSEGELVMSFDVSVFKQ